MPLGLHTTAADCHAVSKACIFTFTQQVVCVYVGECSCVCSCSRMCVCSCVNHVSKGSCRIGSIWGHCQLYYDSCLLLEPLSPTLSPSPAVEILQGYNCFCCNDYRCVIFFSGISATTSTISSFSL